MIYVWTFSDCEEDNHILVMANSIEEAREKALYYLTKENRKWAGYGSLETYETRNQIRDFAPDEIINDEVFVL